MAKTDEQKAINACRRAGQNPFAYIDYSDLRKGKQNWEYFLKPKSQKKYLIWSAVNEAWWRPDRSGYTSDLHKAGRYSKKEASSITFKFKSENNIAVKLAK